LNINIEINDHIEIELKMAMSSSMYTFFEVYWKCFERTY